ncbi:MAG: hypothetical protein ACRCXL_12365 [Dermatophilaceae bacterium]
MSLSTDPSTDILIWRQARMTVALSDRPVLLACPGQMTCALG